MIVSRNTTLAYPSVYIRFLFPQKDSACLKVPASFNAHIASSEQLEQTLQSC